MVADHATGSPPGRALDQPRAAAPPPWRVKLTLTLVAWLVAFAIVTMLLSVFGRQLGSLPLTIRALVMSGILVTVMTQLVMPAFDVAVRRWLSGPSQRRAA